RSLMPPPEDRDPDPDDRPRRRGRDDDFEDDRPRRRKRDDFEPIELLVPTTDVSAWSICSCYLGLGGMCLPGIGLIFAIPALICGIIALRKRKKADSYGRVTSDIRAILGIVFSSI